MPWFLQLIWSYRTEIILTLQLLEKMRKTAAETAAEYIRIQIRRGLVNGLLSLFFQISLLWVAHLLCLHRPGQRSERYASVVLWLITLNNLFQLFFFSIPELKGVYRLLRGKVGFAMKYFFGVSLTTELTRPSLLILIFCLILGLGSRTQMARSFSYFAPWHKNRAPHSLSAAPLISPK